MVIAVFLKENVRYLVWTCRDPISLSNAFKIFQSNFKMLHNAFIMRMTATKFS